MGPLFFRGPLSRWRRSLEDEVVGQPGPVAAVEACPGRDRRTGAPRAPRPRNSRLRLPESLRVPSLIGYASPARMATSCPKCGGTKTESVRAGLLYWLANAFGYRLRLCGRCRSYRLFRRGGESHGSRSREPQEEQPSQAQPTATATAAAEAQAAPAASGSNPSQEQPRERTYSCPRCGSKDYRRSRRRWLERRQGSPPMLRCRSCNHRFPLPGY